MRDIPPKERLQRSTIDSPKGGAAYGLVKDRSILFDLNFSFD